MRKWVFIHLPKTAGTSFQFALRRIAGEEAVSPGFVASRLSLEEANRLDRYRVISGHISFHDVARYFPDRAILTILRDPVERCLSWYYFARAAPPAAETPVDVRAAQNNGVDDFFALDRRIVHRNIYNRQVRQLGAHVLDVDADCDKALETAKQTLSAAAWVGRQESLASDILALGDKFPEWKGLAAPVLNQSVDSARNAGNAPELLTKIRNFNRYDLELHEFARSHLFR